jgi:hypothetical protein
MGIVNDIIGEQHDEEIKRLKEERDYYKTAPNTFDWAYMIDKSGTEQATFNEYRMTLDEFCVALNDDFMVNEFKDNMKNIKDKLKTGRMWFNYWNVFMIYNQKKALLSDEYVDCNGNPVTLEKLCRDEPEWAANTIRMLKSKLSNAM